MGEISYQLLFVGEILEKLSGKIFKLIVEPHDSLLGKVDIEGL